MIFISELFSFEEITENPGPDGTAFLRMKLYAAVVLMSDGRTEGRVGVPAGCDTLLTLFSIERVNEIDVLILSDVTEQVIFRVTDRVPSHVGYLLPYGGKKTYSGRKYRQTGGVPLFAVFTHQLKTEADAEKRLGKGGEHLIEVGASEILHGTVGFTHSRKDHPGGISESLLIIGHDTLIAQTIKGTEN